jgi:parvulin-like peptidyl-prolyl isomerase
MTNNEKLKVVFDFIYYYLNESNNETTNIKNEETEVKTNGNVLNGFIDVQRANDLIKSIQVRDNLNANVNRTASEYEKKIKDYFINLKRDFEDNLKAYDEEEDLNVDLLKEETTDETETSYNTTDSIVNIDNTIVTPKPITSVLDTKKKVTTKKR